MKYNQKEIEAGIFNESTKARMDELEEQKAELKSANYSGDKRTINPDYVSGRDFYI